MALPAESQHCSHPIRDEFIAASLKPMGRDPEKPRTELSIDPIRRWIMLRSIRALVDVIGIDHVCIGTDTKLTQPSARPGGAGPGQQRPRAGERTNQAWEDQTAGFYYVVVDAMLKTGFTQDEIAKIGGGNFLRVFGEAVKE